MSVDKLVLLVENDQLRKEIERLQGIVDAVKKYTELKAKAEELTSEQWAAAEAKWQEIVQQVTQLAAKAGGK